MSGSGLSAAPGHRLGPVLILGHGAVGNWLAQLLSTHAVGLTVVDRNPDLADRQQGVHRLHADLTADELNVWRDALAQASVIVLSLPETVVTAVLPTIAAHARSDALIVETCSVKTAVAMALHTHWPARPALGINPLFRPSLGTQGRRIAVVDHHRDAAVETIEQLLQDAGAGLVRLGADEHDRLCAVTQTLTHATLLVFGAALAEACTELSIPDLMAMAPPPFLALLSLTVRVGAGEIALYREIQVAERGPQLRELLAGALADLQRVVGDEAEFGRLQKTVLDALGPDLSTKLLSTSENLLIGLR